MLQQYHDRAMQGTMGSSTSALTLTQTAPRSRNCNSAVNVWM